MAFFNKQTKNPPQNVQQAQQALSILDDNASMQRRIRMQKRIDYYYDKQEEYLDNLINEQFTYPDRLKLQKEFFNITQLIVDELSIVYNQDPIRDLHNGSDKDNEIYAQIVKDSGLNQIMQQVNRFTKLCKTCAIRPVWRDEMIQYDIYTPNIYDVFQELKDPTKMEAIVWSNFIDTKNEQPTNNDDKRTNYDPFDSAQNVYYYMDDDKFIVFTRSLEANGASKIKVEINDDNPDNENPYGVLPVVTSRDGVPIDEYFLEGGDGLIATNEVINVKLTELNHLTKMQSFSIPVRKGAPTESDDIIMDPSMVVDIPGDDDQSRNNDFKFVSPDSKVTDMENTIDSKIKKIALKHHLSPERFVLSAQKSSAEALQTRAWDQGKILKRDKPFYANVEKQLFEMTRIVWNYHNPGNSISEDAELFIDFHDIEVPMTVEQRDQHNILMYNNGLLSKKRWLMSENPDIKSDEQAEEILQGISDESKVEVDFSPQLPNSPTQEVKEEDSVGDE